MIYFKVCLTIGFIYLTQPKIHAVSCSRNAVSQWETSSHYDKEKTTSKDTKQRTEQSACKVEAGNSIEQKTIELET